MSNNAYVLPLIILFLSDLLFSCRVSLYLDPQIRDWVLFPITLVMVRVRVHLQLWVRYASLTLTVLDIGRHT